MAEGLTKLHMDADAGQVVRYPAWVPMPRSLFDAIYRGANEIPASIVERLRPGVGRGWRIGSRRTGSCEL